MTIDRSTCPAPRHGTEHAYTDGGCRCPDARTAHATYRRGLRAGIRRLTTATRTRRQLQGLQVAGHSLKHLGTELGVTSRVVAGYTTQAMVSRFTQTLVDELTDKLRDHPGTSTHTARRAQARCWLPIEAWRHSDINSTHPLAEVTALLGWLAWAEDPLPAVTELVRRYNTLPLIAQQITARRGHALYVTGATSPAVHQAELLYHRHHWSPRFPEPLRGRAA